MIDTLVAHKTDWSGQLVLAWKYKEPEVFSNIIAVHCTESDWMITQEVNLPDEYQITVISKSDVDHINIRMTKTD